MSIYESIGLAVVIFGTAMSLFTVLCFAGFGLWVAWQCFLSGSEMLIPVRLPLKFKSERS